MIIINELISITFICLSSEKKKFLSLNVLNRAMTTLLHYNKKRTIHHVVSPFPKFSHYPISPSVSFVENMNYPSNESRNEEGHLLYFFSFRQVSELESKNHQI